MLSSYRIILFALLLMVLAGVMLHFELVEYVAYALLVIGFFGIGIGILLGFYRMIREQ